MSAARRHQFRSLAAAIAMLLLIAIAQPAQSLDVTVGDVVVEQLSEYGFVDTTSVLSFDGGTTDQLYQMFAFLGVRTPGSIGTVEVNATNFSISSAITQSGNSASASLSLNAGVLPGLGADAIRIDYTFTLFDDTSVNDDDGFNWDITLENNSGTGLDFSLYTYLDLDIDGASDFADDSAIGNVDYIRVWDNDTGTEYFWVASNNGSADFFEILPYQTLRDNLRAMTTPTDLTSPSAQFGPADFTGAFQYDFTLADGATSSIGMGSVATVPEPNSALLLLIGLVGLGLRAKRRADS